MGPGKLRLAQNEFSSTLTFLLPRTDDSDQVLAVGDVVRITELKMGGRKRSLEETLDYAIAVGRFDSAFEACEQLHPNDRELLLEAMAERIVKRLAKEPAEEGPK